MAAITYGKSVTAAEQYHGIINAEKFSSIVFKYFASMFKKSVNLRMTDNPKRFCCLFRKSQDHAEIDAYLCGRQNYPFHGQGNQRSH